VSFPDPGEERTWLFDVTFLLSGWQCIYGAGCQGVLTGPAPELEEGCCSYGAHFTGDDDRDRVLAAAETLTEDQWQFRRRGRRSGTVRVDADGATVTRLVEGACIFLNRPDFPGGAGCALHRAALERGRRPLDLKPDVCWQLPLRREDLTDALGHVVSMVGPWDRRHWGDGGKEFHWWCTEAPEAFGARQPVFRRLSDELTELCGPAMFQTVATYLDGRMGASGSPTAAAGSVALPLPSARRRRR
jgi:hypothetical protein